MILYSESCTLPVSSSILLRSSSLHSYILRRNNLKSSSGIHIYLPRAALPYSCVILLINAAKMPFLYSPVRRLRRAGLFTLNIRPEARVKTYHKTLQISSVFSKKAKIFTCFFVQLICSSFAIFSPFGMSLISSVVITRSLITATA